MKVTLDNETLEEGTYTLVQLNVLQSTVKCGKIAVIKRCCI